MTRFFGLMPPDYVEIRKKFRDSSGLTIIIEAGPKGWTIIWADHSVDYGNKDDTSDNNFKMAYNIAMGALGPLLEVEG